MTDISSIAVGKTTASYSVDVSGNTRTTNFYQDISGTAVQQPKIQYGQFSSTGSTGNQAITLAQSYLDTSYNVHAVMRDTNPAQFSVDITARNAFTIYWANAGAGTHSIGWTSFGL